MNTTYAKLQLSDVSCRRYASLAGRYGVGIWREDMGLEFGGKRAPRGESQNFVLFRTIKILWVWGIFNFATANRDRKDRGTAMALRWRQRRRNRNEEAPAHGRELLSDGVSTAGSPAGSIRRRRVHST